MVSKRLIYKDEFGETHTTDEKINGKFVGDKAVREKLFEYEQEESEGKLVHLPCKVGDTVYILEYEDGEAVDYGGWIFLMANNDFALLSPTVNDESHPIELCNFYFERYVECEEHPDFVVIVPLNEIYFTKKAAEKALGEREKK